MPQDKTSSGSYTVPAPGSRITYETGTVADAGEIGSHNNYKERADKQNSYTNSQREKQKNKDGRYVQ